MNGVELPNVPISFESVPMRGLFVWRLPSRMLLMASFRIIGFTGRTFYEPGSPDNFLDIRMTVAVTVNGEERQLAVRMKQVVGSDLSEQALEIYPPRWPDGVNVRDDELREAARPRVAELMKTLED